MRVSTSECDAVKSPLACPQDAWNYGVIADARLELGDCEEAFGAFDQVVPIASESDGLRARGVCPSDHRPLARTVISDAHPRAGVAMLLVTCAIPFAYRTHSRAAEARPDGGKGHRSRSGIGSCADRNSGLPTSHATVVSLECERIRRLGLHAWVQRLVAARRS